MGFQKLAKNAKHAKVMLITICILLGPLVGMSISSTSAQSDQEYFSTDTYATYNINYVIDFTSTDASAVDIISWVSRWTNWTGVQESQLVGIELSSPTDTYSFDPEDIYNNSYDYFGDELQAGGDSLTINIEYQITLSAREWLIPENISLSNYSQSSDLYQLYTSAQIGCEVNDPEIQATATVLTGGETSVTKIAEAIYLFVVSQMNYQILEDAMGAATTLDTLTGDCSEYSSLMVCLLRAAGIPARKVLGLGIITPEGAPRFATSPGDSWEYVSPAADGNVELPGHAWVQYYVPSIGWVSADPTWGQSLYDSGLQTSTAYAEEHSLQYFNRIDHLHLITAVGDFFGEGIEPALVYLDGDTGLLELPFHYTLLSWTKTYLNQELDLTSEIRVEFEVEDSNYVATSWFTPSMIEWATYLSGGLLLALVFLIYAGKKKKKKNRSAQYQGTYTYR